MQMRKNVDATSKEGGSMVMDSSRAVYPLSAARILTAARISDIRAECQLATYTFYVMMIQIYSSQQQWTLYIYRNIL